MKVQSLDLKAQYKSIKREVMSAINEVCDSQHMILGKNVTALEDELSTYAGASYGVGVASGTDAILLALMAFGVGPGDEVLTTSYTFFATAGSIARLGAKPVFVDIDPDTYNIDTNAMEAILKKRKGNRIKAIVPVHLYGQCADMRAIKILAKKYGLKVVEDAAQAIGASYHGAGAGSIGDAGCFSFYPSKNLGGFGDGGMVTTNNKKTAEKVKMLRMHGCKDRYHHRFVGIASRLDELQAAVLKVKLKYLTEWTESRIEKAATYNALFEKAGLAAIIKRPVVSEGNRHVYHQYVISASKRNGLKDHLLANGVGSAVYYPIPLHLQDCFVDLGYKKGDLPVSERAAKETLALPIYPELKRREQKYVVEQIAEFYSIR